jgi:hypothetical protein
LLNLHFQTYLRKSIDFVKYTADNCKRSKKTPSPPTRIIMAENESLDLGASYSQRWDKPFKAIRRGAPCGEWMAIVSARSPKGYRWARLLAMNEPKMEGTTYASA